MSSPASHNAQARTSREFRIAELIGNFKAEQDAAGAWRIRDRAKGAYLVPTYPNEELANSGARLTAAAEIVDYFEGRLK